MGELPRAPSIRVADGAINLNVLPDFAGAGTERGTERGTGGSGAAGTARTRGEALGEADTSTLETQQGRLAGSQGRDVASSFGLRRSRA